jgi:hypothetical protein
MTLALCLLVTLPGSTQTTQFRPFAHDLRNILEGNWQSCREPDGEYGERVWDQKVDGRGIFELHLGPYHEFALFSGVQEEHRDHNSPENLLKPHVVNDVRGIAKHIWRVGDMILEVTLAGGSFTTCESWWVTLRRADNSSH